MRVELFKLLLKSILKDLLPQMITSSHAEFKASECLSREGLCID